MDHHKQPYKEAPHASEHPPFNFRTASIDHAETSLSPAFKFLTSQRDRVLSTSSAGPRKMSEASTLRADSQRTSVGAPGTAVPAQDMLPLPSSAGVWEPLLLSPLRSPWGTSAASFSSTLPPLSPAISGPLHISSSEELSLPLYHTPNVPSASTANNSGAAPGVHALWRDAKWLVSILVDIVAMIAQVVQVFRSSAGA